MPTCIFVLSRFCLRVDNVLFRIHDTRFYHSFSSSPPVIVKETSGWEAPYDMIRQVCWHASLQHTSFDHVLQQQLPNRNDLSPLTDPMFVGRIMSGLPDNITRGAGAGTQWRGLGTKTDILLL
jgi:type 2A phosphatase activator TIP41